MFPESLKPFSNYSWLTGTQRKASRAFALTSRTDTLYIIFIFSQYSNSFLPNLVLSSVKFGNLILSSFEPPFFAGLPLRERFSNKTLSVFGVQKKTVCKTVW